MMNEITKETAEIIICSMENQLKTILKNEPHKQWNECFIKKQIEKRKAGKSFTLQEHIRAMVYSMLSSGNTWADVAKKTDTATGCIPTVDKIFCDYNIGKLKKCTPKQLRDDIKAIHCATQTTLQQMTALLSVNIDKLCSIEKEFGTVDTYYQKFIKIDDTLKTLIIVLSATGSPAKLEQMNIALVCEYLRNVGYDIPKPDRHICRILGSDYLGFSDKNIVPEFEAFDLVVRLAEQTGKSVAQTDYILWSYCAKGYGEICRKNKNNCNICTVKRICNTNMIK